MPEFAPRAKENLEKGTHPDLVRGEDGSLEFRSDVDLPRSERSFRRMWADDNQRAAFMFRLGRAQAQLPRDIQESVAGQHYDGYGSNDAYEGYLQYVADIERQRSPTEFTAADVAAMSLEEYDQYFDERGRPREGVTYEANIGGLGRDIDVRSRDGIDPYSQQEMRQGRSA